MVFTELQIWFLNLLSEVSPSLQTNQFGYQNFSNGLQRRCLQDNAATVIHKSALDLKVMEYLIDNYLNLILFLRDFS